MPRSRLPCCRQLAVRDDAIMNGYALDYKCDVTIGDGGGGGN